MSKELKFELAHIGLNCEEEETALQTAELLAELFHLPVRKGGKSYFAGTAFECIRIPFRGSHGHIALRVSDLSACMQELKAKGIEFSFDNTTEYNADGRIVNVYLKEEIAGFAIHLMQT